VDPAIKMDMKNHIIDTLIDLFELEETGRFRGVMYADDVLAILQEYFSTLGAVCLENQHTGQDEPAGPSMSAFPFSEREALARLLFPQRLLLINSRLKIAVRLLSSTSLYVAAASTHVRGGG